MQNSAALAYQQVGRQTINPRLLEANLLSRAAGQLQRVRDDWDNERHELSAALMFNRKLELRANQPEPHLAGGSTE